MTPVDAAQTVKPVDAAPTVTGAAAPTVTPVPAHADSAPSTFVVDQDIAFQQSPGVVVPGAPAPEGGSFTSGSELTVVAQRSEFAQVRAADGRLG